MIAYGYLRAVGPESFAREPEYPLDQQRADVQKFFDESLASAGFRHLEWLEHPAEDANVPWRQRSSALRLLRDLERHDAIIVPRVDFLAGNVVDLLRTGLLLQRRRVLIFYLDLLPRDFPDSNRFFLESVLKFKCFRSNSERKLLLERLSHSKTNKERQVACRKQNAISNLLKKSPDKFEAMHYLNVQLNWSVDRCADYAREKNWFASTRNNKFLGKKTIIAALREWQRRMGETKVRRKKDD